MSIARDYIVESENRPALERATREVELERLVRLLAVVRMLAVDLGETVVVHQGAADGAHLAHMIQIAGATQVFAIGCHDERNTDGHGVTWFSNLEAAIAALAGRQADALLDFSSDFQALASVLPLVRECGRVLSISGPGSGMVDVNLYTDMHRRSLVVRGMTMSHAVEALAAVELTCVRRFAKDLITHEQFA